MQPKREHVRIEKTGTEAEPGAGGEAETANGEIDRGEDAAVAPAVVSEEIADGRLAAEELVPHLEHPVGASRRAQRQHHQQQQRTKRQEPAGRRRSPRSHPGRDALFIVVRRNLPVLVAPTAASGWSGRLGDGTQEGKRGRGREKTREEEEENETKCAHPLLSFSGRRGLISGETEATTTVRERRRKREAEMLDSVLSPLLITSSSFVHQIGFLLWYL